MIAQELLERLHRRGIELWSDDGRLRYGGPKGALTAELREELARCKPEILQLVDHRRAKEAPMPPLEPMPRAGAIPLSFAQESLWFLNNLYPYNTVAN